MTALATSSMTIRTSSTTTPSAAAAERLRLSVETLISLEELLVLPM